MTDESTEKLSTSQRRDLVIEAGIQLIPYVGGSLCTIYFGAKREKRFERLRSFYSELANEVAEIKDQLASVDQHDKDALQAIIEELNEKVERESNRTKQQFFRNYFKNTLRKPISNDFDKRKYFLQTLADMILLECRVLASVSTQPEFVLVGNMHMSGIDQYAIVGAVGRLKSHGFLISQQETLEIGLGDNALHERIRISGFGAEFKDFCLEG